MSKTNFAKEKLEKLGLTKLETDIFWYLLHNNQQSVYKLSKELSVPRSNMYGIINGLVKRGFVNWQVGKKDKRYVEAVKPEHLGKELQKQKDSIKEAEYTVRALAKYLSFINKEPFKTQVRYYEGREGLEQLVWNTLSCKDGNMYGYSAWDRNKLLTQ